MSKERLIELGLWFVIHLFYNYSHNDVSFCSYWKKHWTRQLAKRWLKIPAFSISSKDLWFRNRQITLILARVMVVHTLCILLLNKLVLVLCMLYSRHEQCVIALVKIILIVCSIFAIFCWSLNIASVCAEWSLAEQPRSIHRPLWSTSVGILIQVFLNSLGDRRVS